MSVGSGEFVRILPSIPDDPYLLAELPTKRLPVQDSARFFFQRHARCSADSISHRVRPPQKRSTSVAISRQALLLPPRHRWQAVHVELPRVVPGDQVAVPCLQTQRRVSTCSPAAKMISP